MDIENPIQVSLTFKDEGGRKFAELTTANVGKRLAIVLDNVVRSAPNLNEPIRDGRAVISGGFTQEEALDLTQILKAGALPARLNRKPAHRRRQPGRGLDPLRRQRSGPGVRSSSSS